MAVETALEKGEEWPLSEVEAPPAEALMAEATSPSTVPGSGGPGDQTSVAPTPKRVSHSRGTSFSAGVRSLIGSIRRPAPQ